MATFHAPTIDAHEVRLPSSTAIGLEVTFNGPFGPPNWWRLLMSRNGVTGAPDVIGYGPDTQSNAAGGYKGIFYVPLFAVFSLVSISGELIPEYVGSKSYLSVPCTLTVEFVDVTRDVVVASKSMAIGG